MELGGVDGGETVETDGSGDGVEWSTPKVVVQRAQSWREVGNVSVFGGLMFGFNPSGYLVLENISYKGGTTYNKIMFGI